MHREANKLPFLAILCIICLWMAPEEAYSQATASPWQQTKTVVDMLGKTVEIPRIVRRIVVTCYGGATNEIAVLGGADKILAQPSVIRFPQLSKIYPRLGKTPDAGSFDAVNVEYVMTLKPDMVIASVYSTRGNRKIEAAGIPVVAVSTGLADINGLLKEFAMMGRVLGEEKRADSLVQYWNGRLSLVRERVAALPEPKKKRVFYTSSGSFLRTEGMMWWGHHFITASGGLNVSKAVGYGGEVTLEQVLRWDPDVILINRDNGRFESIRKVLGKRSIHRCPIGAFWWDRPSPEAILGIIWLAKTLYPGAMADIDLRKETKSFYRIFYGYALTDAEYEAFFVKA